MPEYDIYQVYRTLKDYDNLGNIISQGMLLQVRKIDGGLIGLKTENNKLFWLNWKDLLNKDNFQRVF